MAVLLLLSSRCGAPPPAAPPAGAVADAAWATDVRPTLSVKELMTHFIDPTADWVFDAVVFDASATGTTTTAPVAEEDWQRVERGVWQLAESANLLMMPRPAEPAGTVVEPRTPGQPAPELSGDEIDRKIAADRRKWNRYADGLRVASLSAMTVVRARDVAGVLDAGSAIDGACEACHLEYWYPGDLPAVRADQQKKVTFDPPKPSR